MSQHYNTFMVIGIDFGQRKIGIATAESPLAEPHSVIRVINFDDAVSKCVLLIEKLIPEKIVVGLSEGEMAKESKKFGKVLEELTNIPVTFADETLSSWEAQQKSIEAGKKRLKRKQMEDAYAAAVMLQNYLDKSLNK
jgi:putative Holliday junction resolvase